MAAKAVECELERLIVDSSRRSEYHIDLNIPKYPNGMLNNHLVGHVRLFDVGGVADEVFGFAAV